MIWQVYCFYINFVWGLIQNLFMDFESIDYLSVRYWWRNVEEKEVFFKKKKILRFNYC